MPYNTNMIYYAKLLSFVCFLSIVIGLWLGVLRVIVWDNTFWFAAVVWLIIGTVSAFLDARYGEETTVKK